MCSKCALKTKLINSEWDLELHDYGSIHIFFGRKKFIRKQGPNYKNIKKILGKSQGSISKVQIICWPETDIPS